MTSTATQDEIAHVVGLIEKANDSPVPVGRHDPKHLAFVEAAARRHGYTPERYPGLFNNLRTGRSRARVPTTSQSGPSTYQDGQVIDYVAPLTESKLASAHALVTRIEPVSSMTLLLHVVNIYNGVHTVIASGDSTKFLKQTVEVQTDDSTAKVLPKMGQNYAALTWSIEFEDGTIESSSAGGPWAYQSSTDPKVEAPAQNTSRTNGNLNNIMIGLARGYNTKANNTDIDYWFWQDKTEYNRLLVPFQGSMYFDYPVMDLDSSNPVLQFWLARTEGGMTNPAIGKMAQYVQCFTRDTSNANQLNFSLMPTSTTQGTAIDFGIASWASDTQSFFTAKVSAVLDNGTDEGTMGWSSVLSSLNPDTNSADGVAYIKPIIYLWHCVAAGTQISMADGSISAVENLDAGLMVATSNGSREIQATLAQPHWGPVTLLTTQGGRSLTCSGTHPIVRSDGTAVQAGSLNVGDGITTSSGIDTVSSVTQRQQSGDPLFNLWLAGPSTVGYTYFANGLLVGDYPMQVSMLPGEDPDQVRAALPDHLQKDFESYLEDGRQNASR